MFHGEVGSRLSESRALRGCLAGRGTRRRQLGRQVSPPRALRRPRTPHTRDRSTSRMATGSGGGSTNSAPRTEPVVFSPERVRRLEGLSGWAWNASDADWEEDYSTLSASPPAKATRVSHAPPRGRLSIGQWVSKQRAAPCGPALRRPSRSPRSPARLDLGGEESGGGKPAGSGRNACRVSSSVRLSTLNAQAAARYSPRRAFFSEDR